MKLVGEIAIGKRIEAMTVMNQVVYIRFEDGSNLSIFRTNDGLSPMYLPEDGIIEPLDLEDIMICSLNRVDLEGNEIDSCLTRMNMREDPHVVATGYLRANYSAKIIDGRAVLDEEVDQICQVTHNGEIIAEVRSIKHEIYHQEMKQKEENDDFEV